MLSISIYGNLLQIFQDFLHERKQRIVLNGKSSNLSTVSVGVHQGSVLGPLFFFVYITDLPENFSCKVKLFAEGRPLFSIVNNEHDTGLVLNHDLEKIRMYARQWKISINADKTEEVIFSWERKNPRYSTLKSRNDEIKSCLDY